MSENAHQNLTVIQQGPSPCNRCNAACCRQNGHEFAALLAGDEIRRFAAYSVYVSIQSKNAMTGEFVLPYIDGKCQFLGEDNRCTIYEDRPAACRAFECAPEFNANGIGQHGIFMIRNPRVLRLFES